MNGPRSFLILTLLLLLAAPARAQQFGGSLAISGSDILIGKTANTQQSGIIYVYRQADDGTWHEATRLQASDATGEDDRFGRALATEGDRLLVGATTWGGMLGGAYVFERNPEGAWTETARLTAIDGEEGDHLGRAVGLTGDFAFVSSAGKNESAGAVYIFRRNEDGSWHQAGQLTPTEAHPEQYYGLALAVDGNHALIGAPFADSSAGAVYAYRYDATADAWTHQQTLPGPDSSAFGLEIRLQDEYALIGAPQADANQGAVYAYQYDGDAWNEVAVLTPSAEGQIRMGAAIAFAGTEAWIAAPGANGFQGLVYRFQRTADGTWTETGTLTAEDAQGGDFFGSAIAVEEDLAVISSPGDDFGAGTAFIFTRDADGIWTQQAAVFDEQDPPFDSITGNQVPCTGGTAADFDCEQVDLLSFLSVKDIGGGRGVRTNDIWGWADPDTGREYALVGRMDGTAFVDISDPANPVFVGDLPKTEGSQSSTWRDIKVYKDHAFIVADNANEHGMQVFDLTRLRDVEDAPVTFTEDALYDGIHSAHNIVINEDTGFAYTVGNSAGGETCGGGSHIINIQDPLNPTFAGCFGHTGTGNAGTGYTHDSQCVIYHGPDADYQGHEICFGSNETALSIADVTDKDDPQPLSSASYPKVGYTHQGWLTDDHRYFYMNDEGDEVSGTVEGTRTLIWDVADLEDPILIKEYIADNKASDHNLYIKGNLMYQSNYVSGLRIFDITDPANPVPVGHFDTVPGEDAPGFTGSWSNYPYFKSGVIAVTSMSEGVFFLKKQDVDL